MNRLFLSLIVFVFGVFTLTLSGCKKDDPTPDIRKEENEALYAGMKDWYYWNEQIPQINPSSYADVFAVLEAIRQRPLDRWSYITNLQEFLDFFQNSSFVGYGFGSSWDSMGKLRISFVYSSTQMYAQGVRRSWIIEAINGTSVVPGINVSALLGPNTEGVSNAFLFRKPDGNTTQLSFTKEKINMNTVLHHEIISAEDRKIGYMVLQGFTTPTATELTGVFNDFNEAGIDELILDMRYNGGGSTAIALKLSSMIAGPSLTGEPFAHYLYNSLKSAEHNRTDLFTNEANSLSLNRLVTITTGATASASEMVINGLRPFIDVHIVGSKTYGKPMGMNAFTLNNWALVPITFKIANANNEGDYFNGLPANVPAPDDLTRMFGDPQESMLQAAIAFILSGSTKGEVVPETQVRQPWEDMQGLRRIIGAF